MSSAQHVQIAGKAMRCGACDHPRFHVKTFHLQTGWLQVFDLLPFTKGAALVCERCTHVMHFANSEHVVFADTGEPENRLDDSTRMNIV